MAHLRLFQPQRGTQSLRFPDLLFRSCELALRLPRKLPDPFQRGNVIATGRMSLAVSIARPGSEADQQKLPYLICSCRLALSGFWRNDLTTDFAARIGMGMDVDVPLTGGKLLRLLGRERRLPLDRVFRGAALLAHPHH